MHLIPAAFAPEMNAWILSYCDFETTGPSGVCRPTFLALTGEAAYLQEDHQTRGVSIEETVRQMQTMHIAQTRRDRVKHKQKQDRGRT